MEALQTGDGGHGVRDLQRYLVSVLSRLGAANFAEKHRIIPFHFHERAAGDGQRNPEAQPATGHVLEASLDRGLLDGA